MDEKRIKLIKSIPYEGWIWVDFQPADFGNSGKQLHSFQSINRLRKNHISDV